MAPAAASGELSGFWGPPTSTLDWCEANYEVTYYVAEFWNTVTNLIMIITGLYGIYDSWKQGTEFRFSLCYGILFLVGVGSLMFHMTLLYEMQLLDELPMVWGASYLIYCLYVISYEEEKSSSTSLSIQAFGLILICFSAAVSAIYLIVKNPLIHEGAYGIQVFMMSSMAMRLPRINRDKVKMQLFYVGSALYLVGFVLWNIDNHFCGLITDLRAKVIRPSSRWTGSERHPLIGVLDFSPWTQLHGWWHLLAGYGTYMHVLFTIQVRLNLRDVGCSVVGFCPVGVKLRINDGPSNKDKENKLM